MTQPLPRGAIAAIEAAIDADLERQAKVQSGEYSPARTDDAGVASARMDIVIAEVARAAFGAVAEILVFDCTGFPSMEAKAVEWANKISGPLGQPPFHPDPVGILVMCEEIATAALQDLDR